jgi:FtsP/CotA-like multicopper oxidase with cupredoxin domain
MIFKRNFSENYAHFGGRKEVRSPVLNFGVFENPYLIQIKEGGMFMNFGKFLNVCLLAATLGFMSAPGALAQPAPGGNVDPTMIPKYVIPLVIPPVMNNDGVANSYDIAVRQFQQQILPGGIWNSINGRMDAYDATTVWSYGPDADPTPAVAPDPTSQFNYPAYTFETMSDVPVSVRWINDLVDGSGNYLPHLLPLDQTLHWANPPATGCRDGTNRTDCATDNPKFYTGPVPIVTHVHGAHVDGHSDGYPEAWWLPAASDIPPGYATSGTIFDDVTGTNPGNLGYADYWYRQDQPATTLWYHDHSLGMTRLNVYAGPAGFWLIRGGKYDKLKDTSTNMPAVLPGPAPVAGDTVLELNVPGLVPETIDKRSGIREIPIVIQDRSFDANGAKLFYPDNRAFFEGLNVPGQPQQFPGEPELQIPFVGDLVDDSDIAPIWNPEAFFNVMVVNGVSWPTLDVAQARYRFRLLNGCNSRFLNLALKVGSTAGADLPFFQIGAEQGFLRAVVRIQTNEATPLPGDGTNPAPILPADPQQALLMGLAERADVIVDFSGLADGTVVYMINTAPDAPFGGFPDAPADPGTTGQVMRFVVNSALNGKSATDPTGLTPAASPYNIKLKAEKALKANKVTVTRRVSLNEGESEAVCFTVDIDGNVVQAFDSGGTGDDPLLPPDCLDSVLGDVGALPFGPKEALLGLVDFTDPAAPVGIPLKWTDTTGISTPVNVTLQDGSVVPVSVTENPTQGAIEDWEIYNFTADAHPIHLHLVRFDVIGRAAIPGFVPVNPIVQPWENGFKDTVISYPGEITIVRANFDIAGLYVWHCHIVEHEDNEMMRPFVVSP